MESVYLRDWLKALAVGHEQRIKITRRVPRTRSALLDGWIVDDIAGFSDDGDADDADGGPEGEQFETIYTAPLPFDARPAAYPSFRTRLSNTMLLTGPHGCGKSAAVYAAAEELGWEVFEVYPGIGKRTGGALMNLVGDVGKNHIVAQTKSPGKPKPAINTFFGNGGQRDTLHTAKKDRVDDDEVVFLSSSQGSQKDPIDFLSDPQDEDDEQDAAEKGFKQSLILLDEADLLYEEESTFWPAVISLIAESRRPVILTCNGTSSLLRANEYAVTTG
jgi:DNA polymerase III delta prime subunit